MIALITCLLMAVGVLFYMLLSLNTTVKELKDELRSIDQRLDSTRSEVWECGRKVSRSEKEDELLRSDVQRITDHLKIKFVDMPSVRKIAKVKKPGK